MEENKYYTPKREELHIGFDCEHLYIVSNQDHHIDSSKSKWIKRQITERDVRIPDVSWFRVKYLDKEDIESLGWKENLRQSHFYIQVDKDDFQMYLHDNLEDGFWFIQIYNWNSEFVFQGNIKNKSELKQLMKMLGI
jgi:hypothetical protein